MMINSLHLKICIVFVILFFSPVTIVHGNDSDINQGIITVNSLSTNQIVQPKLYIGNLIVNDGKLPEEGDLIDIKIEILNEDTVTYTDLELRIELEEIALVQHGPKPPPQIYNKSIDILPQLSTTTHQLFFRCSYGQFTMTAGLRYNNTILPNSVETINFQVITNPIGSLTELLMALFGIFIFLLVLVPLPFFLEKLRS